MLDQRILDTLQRLRTAAREAGDPEPDAMTLATTDASGGVHARMVLLKSADPGGITFFTRYDSDKGSQIDAHARVALCLHWKRPEPASQVRVEGRAEKLPAAESDAYFASRERMSQLGAWASLQSRTLGDRAELERRVREFEHRFANQKVPRPPEWGGYRIVPDMVEFWYGRAHRLNERERWDLREGNWHRRWLYP
jgi:pyridoxamine 5'-phosphate oxidase